MPFVRALKITYQTVNCMMSKFLNTENATITIEYSKLLTKFLKNNIKDLENINIKRININCNGANLKQLSTILDKENIDIPIFINIKNYKNCYSDICNSLNKRYYIVIKTTPNQFVKLEYVKDFYYSLDFTWKQKNEIANLLKKHNDLILNIKINDNNLVKSFDALSYITKKATAEYLYFENVFIPKQLIYDCPYNIYLNNEYSKRTYGENIPRNIYIDSIGNVYCACIKNRRIIIGNINCEQLLNVYKGCKLTEGYKEFIKFNEKLMISYLNQYPFDTVDYIYMLEAVMRNDPTS